MTVGKKVSVRDEPQHARRFVLYYIRRNLSDSRHDVESIAQNILLEAWQKDIPVSAQYVRWRVRDYLDYDRRRGGLQQRLYYTQGEHEGEARPDVEEMNASSNVGISDVDTEDLFQTLLSRLPAQWKKMRVLLRYHMKGMSRSKIKEVLGTDSSLFSMHREKVCEIFRPLFLELGYDEEVLEYRKLSRGGRQVRELDE